VTTHPAVPPFAPVAVVFDLDGLLVDSEGRWGEAERAVVASFDRPWDEAIRTLLLGQGPQGAAEALGEHLGIADVGAIRERMLDEALRAFERGVPLKDGASALLDGLRGRVPLAVATNSLRVLAERALAQAGIGEAFDAVVCADDVARPKPAPDPYAEACRRLGVEPSRCVGLEDSPVGMRSARDAGLWVIGCPSFEGQPPGPAHVTVSSLAEVDPAALLVGSA
jgi:HAD superfamily hydrolase (TIGR01509 family)